MRMSTRRSLRLRISLLVAFLGVLLLGLLGGALAWRTERTFRARFGAELHSMTSVLAQNLSAVVAFKDTRMAEEMIQTFVGSTLIRGVVLRTSDGLILAESGAMDRTPVDGLRLASVPVYADGQLIGYLEACSTFDEQLAEARSEAVYLFLFASPSVLIGLLVLYKLVKRWVTDPLRKISEVALNASRRHDYSRRVPVSSEDELGVLAESLNSLFEETDRYASELRASREDLARQLEALQIQMQERLRAEMELSRARAELMEMARQAGMAEVATGVLHNIGNALNSVHISAELVASGPLHGSATALEQLRNLLETPSGPVAQVLEGSEAGMRFRNYLTQFTKTLGDERSRAVQEVSRIRAGVEHLRRIIMSQQEFAKGRRMVEPHRASSLLDESLLLCDNWVRKAEIGVDRLYETDAEVTVDRTQVIQILINLIKNALAAMVDLPAGAGKLVIGVSEAMDSDRVSLWVRDNGVGIPEENLVRVFRAGFTTRVDGHGFGLHSGANAAREMGGSLRAESAGPGRGSTFVLELPRSRASHLL